MTKNLLKNITLLIIILGVISYSFSVTWSLFELPYLTKQELPYTTIYYFDTETYLNNLDLSWTGLQKLWEQLLPTRQWQDGGSIVNWGPFFNNLALLFDYLYMPLNFILEIIRSICFINIKLLSICGIVTQPNTVIHGITYQPPWFVIILTTIKDYFIIPYI